MLLTKIFLKIDASDKAHFEVFPKEKGGIFIMPCDSKAYDSHDFRAFWTHQLLFIVLITDHCSLFTIHL